MVFGIKGLLSKQIANALSDYFEVDSKAIESNLVKDAKVVLNNVKLRPVLKQMQHPDVAGRPVSISINGQVEQVAFTWAWSIANDEGWIKNATLTISGMKFKAKLEYQTVDVESDEEQKQPKLDSKPDSPSEKSSGIKAFIEKQVKLMIDSLTLKVVDFEFSVEMPPLPSDTGEAVCYSLVMGGQELELLSFGHYKLDNASIPYQNEAASPDGNLVLEQRFSIGSTYCNILSWPLDQNEADAAAVEYPVVEPFSYLATVTRLAGTRFQSGLGFGLEIVGTPMALEKDGDGWVDRGVVMHAEEEQIKALSHLARIMLSPSSEPIDASEGDSQEGDTVMEEGKEELPAEESSADDKIEPITGEKETSEMTNDMETTQDSLVDSSSGEESSAKDEIVVNASSLMKMDVGAMSLVLADGSVISLGLLSVAYRADGMLCSVKAQNFSVKDQNDPKNGMNVVISGINATVKPNLMVQFDLVEQLHVPGTFSLIKPIENSTIKMVGGMYIVNVDSVEGIRLKKADPVPADDELKTDPIMPEESRDSFVSEHSTVEDAGTVTEDVEVTKSGTISIESANERKEQKDMEELEPKKATVSLSVPVSISIRQLLVKKEQDRGAPTKVTDIIMSAQPHERGTFVGCCVGELRNDLLQLTNAAASGVVNIAGDVEEVLEATFATEHGIVTAGYATDDWYDTFELEEGVFEPEKKKSIKKDKEAKKESDSKSASAKKKKSSFIKLPFAKVSALKLQISFKSGVVSSKDTKIDIKPYIGKADTTSKDLVDFYTRVILARVPGFLTNSKVLGIHVVDSTVATYATWLSNATPWGATGGLAGIAVVDGIKGAMKVGMTQRNEEAQEWRFGDFMRGIVYTPQALAEAGAARRGKVDGANVTDFAVGVTTELGDYAGENKARLGGAAAAGVGFALGTLVGGPLGGIAGGVFANALTGKVIEDVEGHLEKNKQKLLEDAVNDAAQRIEEGDQTGQELLLANNEAVPADGSDVAPQLDD